MVEWGFLKFSADAQKCFDEVQSLGKKYTTEQVLELARNPETELHKCFDWDDSSAAEKWRIQQARNVCWSFVVRIEKHTGEQKTYRVVQHDPEEQAYKPVTFTVRNENEYSRLLSRARVEMTDFRNRYRQIVELEGVISAIEEALTA